MGVDAGGQRGRTRRRRRKGQSTKLGRIGADHIDEGGAAQGRTTGEIEVIGDDHDGSGVQILSDAADRCGENNGGTAGGDAGSEGMDDFAQLNALIGVAAAGEHQHPLGADLDGPSHSMVTRRGVAGKEGQGSQGDRGSGGAELRGGGSKAGPKDHQNVVMVDPGATRQLASGAGCIVRCLAHSALPIRSQ